ncbi:sushi, von Willebrand factor type A, EGF and pentraxin domain-containing protein 1-like [Amphibalanus amphitrite]|uniref:sushi, von Willebrand factor type A, EGF and pentraxin domain-containing protein 1-like n=1 Tax=Amphibalanus amphitrite TaxID=1232801 RepID=UPI001C927272|nr:sushi, von Willebrand factor type A, EGF and pentraxin domain-containing protein 1-like [Amphibalanus amphitrite]
MRIFVYLTALLGLSSSLPHDTTYPDTDGRSFVNFNISPPRKFTNQALSKAEACRDPSGFTGYCVASAACRAFNGTQGARCPKRPAGTGTCCLVDRCPVAPPTVPSGGAVITAPIPGSGSAVGTEIQFICQPGLVFEGIPEVMVTATCDVRGTWSPAVIPNCVPAPPTVCVSEPPSAPADVLVSDGGDRFIGALVYYVCTSGTFGDGRAITAARCGEDGLWSPETLPECVTAPPTECSSPPPAAPAGVLQHFDGNLTIGALSLYTCAATGMVFPSGASFLLATCHEDGTWQPDDVPSCAQPVATLSHGY